MRFQLFQSLHSYLSLVRPTRSIVCINKSAFVPCQKSSQNVLCAWEMLCLYREAIESESLREHADFEFFLLSTAGYYCPNSTDVPIKCEYPYYCPLGSSSLLQCPLGYMATRNPGNRTSTGDSCSICPGGFYGNHPFRYNCSICIEGYFCPAGTTGPYKNPCPVGYYCPAKSAANVSALSSVCILLTYCWLSRFIFVDFFYS